MLKDIVWKEVSPGYYERPYELHQTSDRSKQLRSSGVKLSPIDNFVEKCKRAWITARHHHPNIAMVEGQTGYSYKVPNDKELEQWVEQTMVVITQYPSTQSMALALPVSKYRLMLLVFPNEYAIFSRCRHHDIDNYGAMAILENLIVFISEQDQTQISRPRFANEAKYFPPTLHNALGLPEPEPEDFIKPLTSLHDFIKLPPLGLNHRPATQPRATQFKQMKFSPQQSSLLIQSCKEKGWKVAQATSAALALTTKHHANNGDRYFASHILFDHRKYFEQPYNDTNKYPFMLAAVPYFFAIKPTTFNLTADQFGAFFANIKAQLVELAKGYEVYFKTLIDTNTRSSTIITGHSGVLGLKQAYGNIRVLEFWSTVQCHTPDVYFMIWTWKDQLTVTISWNESYYSERDIDRMYGLFRNILSEGLEVVL